MAKRVYQHLLIGHRRNNHRNTASSHNRLIIPLPQLTRQIVVIAGDADDRLTLCLRVTGIDVVEIGL
jgi:hypothetical protein